MDFNNFLSSMEPRARIWLWIGTGLIALLTIGMLWWALSPRQQLLFGSLREADAAEISQSLMEWKVPHEFVNGGAGITVPANLVYETRMRLVSAGVPRGGHVGFELFDDSDFGVTEFAQRVNFQRALQGEIERTIASLPAVETTRVHLTIRRPGLFVGEREASKASIAVGLHPGESLGRQQISGIRNLVASAVEGLSADQVVVLDSSGALLAGGSSEVAGGQGLLERDDEEARLEARIRARVNELLGRILSIEQFHVSVDAVLNFDAVHEVSERPLAYGLGGDGILVRKRVNSSDSPNGNGLSQSQEESEFVHGTTRAEISRAPGRIERLSVAVLLPPALDERQVARIRSLVAASAGIEPERGDRLEVSRVGRHEGWQTAPIPATELDAVPDEVIVDEVLTPAEPMRDRVWVWGLAAALGLLIGVIGAIAMQSRPRKLRAEEREAVLSKLRGWLAEGGTLS